MSLNDNFWSRVSKEQDNFTKKERILINYISNNSHKISNITISTLSKENNLGYSVIYKLIKKLGFYSYRNFIISLASQENTFIAINREIFGDKNQLKESYKRLIDLNDSVIDYQKVFNFITWLNKRRKSLIYIAGVGSSGIGAEDLAIKLYRFGLKTICLNRDDDDILIHCSLLQKNDILILVSISAKTKTIVEAAQIAKERNVPVIIVTSQDKSLLSDYADWQFTVVSSNIYEEQKNFVSPLFALIYFNDLLVSYILKLSDSQWYFNNYLETTRVIKKI